MNIEKPDLRDNFESTRKESEYSKLVKDVKKNYQWNSETFFMVIILGIPTLIAFGFFLGDPHSHFFVGTLSALIGIFLAVFFSFITFLNEENYVSSCVRRLEKLNNATIDRIQRRASVNTNITLIFTFLPNLFLIFFLSVAPRALDTLNSTDISIDLRALIGSSVGFFVLLIVPVVILYTHFMIRRAHVNIIIRHACIECIGKESHVDMNIKS